MKKKILSLLLVCAMVLSLIPTVAFAADAPTATKRIALAAPSGDAVMSSGKHADGTTVVYYGGIPWIVLTMDYDKNGTANDPLLLSEFAYGYGTQWMAYYTNSDRSGTDQAKGYLGSDIRGYINGANAEAKTGNPAGPGENTFTAFRPTQYYGEAATNSTYTRYWERVTVTETEPVDGTVYFVKDSTPAYIGTGVTFASADEFAAAQGGNELYTKSGSDYTPATEWVSGTTYYYETTPYVLADVGSGFAAETTYYTFQKPTAFLKVSEADASANVAKAYYYAGYSVTGLDAAAAGAPRTILAGMPTGGKTLAGDLGLGAADLAALNAVTAAGLGTSEKYTSTTNTSTQYSYYGGALEGDKLFLLSAEEADIYLPSQTQRVARYGSASGATANWWLRSSSTTNNAGNVNTSGVLNYSNANYDTIGVRPALNLNLESVIFTSAASETSGKSSASEASGDAIFVPLAKSTDTAGFKLTLKDETNFGVEAKLLKKNADNSYTVAYENAKLPTGAGNVYVSAILTDSTGECVYGYTKLAEVTENNQSGTGTFVLPEGITLDADHVLKIFEEQCNDWNQNDYASVPAAMTVSAISEITEIATAVEGKTFEAGTDGIANTDLTVKAKYSNDYVLTLTADDFTIEKPANYGTTFHIEGTLTGESQSQTVTVKSAEDETKTKTFDVTVTGQAQAAPSVGIEANESNWTLSGMTTDMEYNTSSATEAAGNWTTYSSSVIDANKTYYVRYKAHDDFAPGAVRTVTMPASGAATYAVTVTLSGIETAEQALKTVDLIGQGAAPSYYDYQGEAIVVDGTYDVYVNNANATAPVDTGVDVAVSGAAASATVTFVPVTFDYNIIGEDDDVVNVLSGVSYDAATETAKATTLAGNNGLSFTAFADAAPYTVTAAKEVKAQYTVLGATDTAALSVTELTNDNAIPTPGATTFTYGGYAYEQSAWSMDSVTLGTTTAAFGGSYAYKLTVSPVYGYTFTNELATALGEGWTYDSGNLVKTFAAITAGYPITVTNLPTSVTSVTYKLNSGAENTLAVSGGTVVISAPAHANYRLTVKGSDDVTYVGNVDLTGVTSKSVNCVSAASDIPTDELVQQAPALTMAPNKDSTDVTLSQKSVIVTVDQDVTLAGNKALMYVYSSDANRENDVYTAVYEQTITSAMYDEATRALELNLASFRSGSSYLTTLTSGYSYKLVLAEGTVKGKNGVAQLGNAEFAAYFKPTATLGFTVQLLKPLNGSVYAYRTGNTSVTTGTGSLTAAMGDTVTVYTRPDVGYVFDSYTYKWNGAAVTQDELVTNSILTVDPEDSSIIYVVADAASTLRVVANFKLDDGITEYTVTQDKTAYSVCVGSSVTLSYVVTPSGTGLAFESSNSDVAAASGSTVYGVSVGTATVTAKDPRDNVVATWTINVVPAQTGIPQITTNEATGVTANSATLSGTITGTGFIVRDAGIVLKTVGGANQYFPMATVPADGQVSVKVTGLAPGATYYYSAYAITAANLTYTDAVYGDQDTAMTFTTKKPASDTSAIDLTLKSDKEKVEQGDSVKLTMNYSGANSTFAQVTVTYNSDLFTVGTPVAPAGVICTTTTPGIVKITVSNAADPSNPVKDISIPFTAKTISAPADGLFALTQTDFASIDTLEPGSLIPTTGHSATVTVTDYFKVTFNANGHGTAPAAIEKAEWNKTITEPTAPTANGYTFGGWYKENGCTNKWNFASDKVAADMNLFAKWTPTQYTITYDANGGTAKESANYNIEAASILGETTYAGHAFTGWEVVSTTGNWGAVGTVYGKDQTVTGKYGDVTFKAVWDEETYNVSDVKASDDGTGTYTAPIAIGSDKAGVLSAYTGTVAPYNAIYAYTVTADDGNGKTETAAMNGDQFTLTAEQIANLGGDFTISVSGVFDGGTVEVSTEFVGLWAEVILTVDPAKDCGKYTYDGKEMFKIADHTYAYLVYQKDSVALTVDVAKSNILVGTKSCEDIYSTSMNKYDVTADRAVNILDASYAHYCSMSVYDQQEWMALYLRADIDADRNVDSHDVADIINQIK